MPREIKFRGRRLDNGEWVFGYYSMWKQGAYHYIGYEDSEGDWIEWKVDPVTIGQYIGRKDINGAEIYEGHKLQSKYVPEKQFLVRFGEHLAYCELDDAIMPTIGFYAEDISDPGSRYPLGNTELWALIADNTSEEEK